MRFFVTLFAFPLILVGCDTPDKFEAREGRLESALKNNEEGLGSKAVWLVKRSSLAPDDRTAVFFGYGDNRTACEDFVTAYQQVNPDVEYACDALD